MSRKIVLVIMTTLACAGWLLASGQSQRTTAPLPEGFNGTGYPIVNEPVTLKVYKQINAEQTKPFNEISVVQDLAETTNVNIDWITPLTTVSAQTVNLLFASNDLPDMFMDGVSEVQAYLYGQQGFIIPLDDLIEKYGPIQQEFLKETPGLKERVTAPDGKLYTSFSFGNVYHNDLGDMLYINREWINALGRPIPTTTAEFEAILKEFKARDMNGNGDTDDEIPLGYVFYTKNANWSDLTFFGSFGIQMDQATNFIALDDGKVVYEPATTHFKNGIKWLASLYSQGLVDKEAYVQDRNQMKAKATQVPPPYGAYVSWFSANVGGENGIYYEIVGPLKGPEGHQYANWHPRALMFAGPSITSACAIPEVAMRWLDTVYEPEWNYQLTYGKLGEFTAKSADGTWSILPPPPGQTPSQVRFLNSLHVVPFTAGVALKQELPSHFIEKNNAKRELFIDHLPTDRAVPFFILQEADQAEFDAVMPDIITYTQQKWAEWVMKGTIDAEWDAYIQRLNAMGLETALQLWQKAYDQLGP